MSSTILKISSKINSKINKISSSAQSSGEESDINEVLDAINKTRNDILNYIEQSKSLEKLFAEITWLDIKTKAEENRIKNVIKLANEYLKTLGKQLKLYKKNLYPHNICKEQIEDLEIAFEDFEETIHEVEEIFFVLRKDDEFNRLVNS